jgi:hypothetical protein
MLSLKLEAWPMPCALKTQTKKGKKGGTAMTKRMDSPLATQGQVLELVSAIVQSLPKNMTAEKVQYWRGG